VKETPMLPDTAASKVTAAHLSRTALLYLLPELRDVAAGQKPGRRRKRVAPV